MLNQVAEQKAHAIRYVLVVGWLLLIRAASPDTCIRLQGECIKGGTIPYQAGARIFWGFSEGITLEDKNGNYHH